MNVLYVYGAFFDTHVFGINGLMGMSTVQYAVCVVVTLGAAALLGAVNPAIALDGQAAAIIAAAASWPVFFFLRTNLLNADGNMLTPKFESDVPRLGAHLTHDELLELWVHSRIWHYTHQWWGWSVVFSYQVLSCLAGSVFIYGMLRLAGRLSPARSWLFLAGALGGGYLQLFFGDVENYTITAALIVLFVLAAWRFLAGESGLWLPTCVLALAMCFHLETGWLLPSLLYLFAVSSSREGNTHDVVKSAAAGAAIGVGTLFYFHFNGLPVWRFFSSHAGHALRMNGVFAIGMPRTYYVEQLDLLLLLCPAVAMLVPLAIWHRERDEGTRFLAIAAGSMLLLQLVWKAQLGVFDDWNLYAIGGMLTGLFIWRGVTAAAQTAPARITAAALAATGWLHTSAWILMNHRHGH